jgi:hypothetical protein
MRPDDRATALQAAAIALAPSLAQMPNCLTGLQASIPDMSAAVIAMAETFLPWLRALGSGRLTLVAIEEIDTGVVVSTPTGGESMPAIIDSSQRARWTFTAKDDRGFAADYALAARLHDGDPAIVTVEYLNVGDPGNTSNGTTDPATGASTEFDQVLATFAGSFGTATVEVYDPAGDTTVVIDSDTVTTEPGAVAPGGLGEPVVEEIPA